MVNKKSKGKQRGGKKNRENLAIGYRRMKKKTGANLDGKRLVKNLNKENDGPGAKRKERTEGRTEKKVG